MMVMKGSAQTQTNQLPPWPVAGEVPEAWLHALERFQRSTQTLEEAYHALERQINVLNLELQKTNEELQENLREKERLQSYLSHILEGLSVGVIVTDLQGRITLINRAARDLLALQGEGIGGQAVEELSKGLTAGDVRTLMSRVDAEQGVAIERCLRRGAGDPLHLTLRSQRLTDATSHGIGVLLTVEDITELRSMEEEVARSQRLSAMGEMAVSIAHEVRNPLGSIELFASLMAQEGAAEARKGIMGQIQSAIGAVDHILSNLLTFAKPLRLTLARLALGPVLEDCLGFARPLAQQRGVSLEFESTPGILSVEVDRDLLKQAILNLLLNGLQATPEGGAIKVRVWEIHATFHGREEPVREEPQRLAEIRIEDTGEGIPPETLPRVFDPFFTTRSEGTGLGLAIVHNIVRAHGGSVRIQSEPGVGTCVRLRLPLTQSGA